MRCRTESSASFSPGCLCLALALAQPAGATRQAPDWVPIESDYSQGEDCQGNVDPIGLVMFGEGITGQNQQEMVQFHTGWEAGDSAPRQATLNSGFVCDAMDIDNQSDCGTCDRRHVRLNYVGHPRYFAYAAGSVVSTSDNVVVGTPHSELWDDDCKDGGFLGSGTGGHRTWSFSDARDYVTSAMASEHPWEPVWYGNNERRPQCTERETSWASGDGVVHYIFSWPIDSPPPWKAECDEGVGGGTC